MKHIVKLFNTTALILFTAIMLTGCIEVSTNTNINNDGTGKQTITIQISKKMLTETGDDPEKALQELIKTGKENNPDAKFTPINTKTHIGATMERNFIWEGKNSNLNLKESPAGKQHIMRTGTQIGISIEPVDLTKTQEVPAETEKALDLIYDKYEISVTMPGKILQANYGAKIEDNTVTWDLDSILDAIQNNKPLQAKTETQVVPSWVVYSICGALLVILVTALAIVMVRRNNEKKNTLPPVEETLVPTVNLDTPIHKPSTGSTKTPTISETPPKSKGLPPRLRKPNP